MLSNLRVLYSSAPNPNSFKGPFPADSPKTNCGLSFLLLYLYLFARFGKAPLDPVCDKITRQAAMNALSLALGCRELRQI